MFAASKTAGAVSAAPPASSDPQFNYVSLLLNDTGTNGQQNNTFLDSSSNNFTITRNGTPTQGSVTPYWPDGQWSNYFGGTNTYLTAPYTAASQFGTNSFTMEAWINVSSTARFNYVYNQTNASIPNNSALGAFFLAYNDTIYFGWCSGTTQYNLRSDAGTIKANTWYHVACVRDGNTFNLYINGVLQKTTTSSVSINAPASTPAQYIGRVNNEGDTSAMIGYISNLRIVNGTALYTSNFTPSTTPLTAVSGTSLLTCQSNRFKDNSSNNFAITVTGTPTVQAFEPFEPASSYATSVGGSGYFPGSSSGLSTAANTAFAVGTGDFTIEFWAYWTSVSSTVPGNVAHCVSNGSLGIYITNTQLQIARYNTGGDLTASTTQVANQWDHYAFVRRSGTGYIYKNGVQVATGAVSTNYGQNGFVVGYGISSSVVGYISNFRFVNGTAVYTAAFTPPTSPVTAITGTSLLLNCTNAGIYDAATLNDLVTVGNAQVSTAQAKFGSSSIAFDGTGDWLTFPDSPVMQLGTGNFTIEGWLYLPILGTARGIVSKGTSTTGWSVGVNLLNQFTFAYTTSTLTAATALTMGQWIHFAVVRNGSATGNVKIYFNGVLDATSGGAINDNFNQTSIGYVGADRVGTSPMNGYIDELRITKGYARYTSAFTPPTAPFPTR